MQIDNELPKETDSDNTIEAACSLITRFLSSEDDEIISHARGRSDTIIDIMQGKEYVKSFAVSRGLDLEVLARGACLILRNMHLNKERNYYAVLGLHDNASYEEVHTKWKRLISLYHPDRHSNDESRFEDVAAMVNEAYNTLKDPVKRSEHDRYLNKLYLQKRFPDAPRSADEVKSNFALHLWVIYLKQVKRRAAFFLAISLILVVSLTIAIFLKNRPPVVSAEYGSVSSLIDSVRSPDHAFDSSSSVGATAGNKVAANMTKGCDVSASEVTSIGEEKHSSSSANIRHDITNSVTYAESVPAQTLNITREEAVALLHKYAEAYSRSNLKNMMSLFSMSATENNLSYQEIQQKYSELFSGRINYYVIDNPEIKTEGSTATVMASYRLDSYIGKDDRWTKAKGKAVWKMSVEDGSLRIINIIYDR